MIFNHFVPFELGLWLCLVDVHWHCLQADLAIHTALHFKSAFCKVHL